MLPLSPRHGTPRQSQSPWDIVQEIKSLYPVDPDPATSLSNQITNIFIFPP